MTDITAETYTYTLINLLTTYKLRYLPGADLPGADSPGRDPQVLITWELLDRFSKYIFV